MTLAIYCAGGLGKEVIALARSVSRWDYIIFVDDIIDVEWYEGAKVYRFDEVEFIPDKVEFVIASGEPSVREILFNKIKDAGFSLTTIIGQGCTIRNAKIGEGCILYDCGLSNDVVVEDNVLINTKAVIGHDCVIGAHSVLSAFCFLGGLTSIFSRVYVGPGAMVKDRISVGEDAILSMGAVILRHVKKGSIMLGNPAKKIGINTEKKIFGIFK